MLDENLYRLQEKPRPNRRDVRSRIGTAFCCLVLAYVMTVAIVGILAS